MIGFRAVKLFVFGGDQDETLEDRLEEEEDLLPDLLEENIEPPPLLPPPPHRPPPPLPLASTDKNMTKIKTKTRNTFIKAMAIPAVLQDCLFDQYNNSKLELSK